MVLGIDLEIFAVYLCANIAITYVWIWITPKSGGPSPKFFQKLYKVALSIWSIQNTPKMLHQFLLGFPWKCDIQQKLQFSGLPSTNCVRGWCPRYGAFLEGLVFYQIDILVMARYSHKGHDTIRYDPKVLLCM